jgi:beta-phosphoglucomutase-like phosphatase (HAD superfamily)
MADYLTAAAAAWGNRLGIAPHTFLDALYAGNDDQILIGRTTETAWWRTIADRLHINQRQAAAIRADLLARQTWNTTLITELRRIRARATITIVSNAWPDIRTSMADTGLLDLADTVALSCEIGYAKPDPRIYTIALRRPSRPGRRAFHRRHPRLRQRRQVTGYERSPAHRHRRDPHADRDVRRRLIHPRSGMNSSPAAPAKP